MDAAAVNGNVLRIEKTSIHEGSGLRTVVFLKGCPLWCKWCSTPESQKFEMECSGGLSEPVQENEYSYGISMSAKEVIREVTKDAIFFFHSGGGVTISGGEVLAQADFAAAILKCLLRGRNLHCDRDQSFCRLFRDRKAAPIFAVNVY